MSTLRDAWGSPGYVLLTGLCQQAADDHEAYERRGSLADLDRAITGFSGVLAVAENVDVRSAAANGLGVALWSRYERFGRLADLAEAIALFRAAVAMYPDEKTAFIPAFQANLAAVLHLRWTRTRSGEDLAGAMKAARAAVAGTSPAQSQRCGRLSGLASILLAVYVCYDDSSALSQAVELYRDAIDSGSAGPEDRAWASANLAEALRLRYRSAGGRDRSVLDEAVARARAALAATPATHPLHPRFQSNLALALLDRSRSGNSPADLAEATTLARGAVRATPAGHPNRAERLGTLARVRQANLTAALLRPGRRGTRRALGQMIRSADEAMAAVPCGHIARPDALLRKGWALGVRAVAGNDAAAYAAAIACYRQLAQDPGAPVSVRVAAGWRWALSEISRTGGADWSAAMAPFELAVNLLPRTAPRRITHADRERQLAGFSGLARDAAACAIQLGQPELAVRLLEHGRGVLLGQTLDSRSELGGLHQSHPGLARRLEELRGTLDLPEDARYIADSLAPVRGGGSAAGLAGEERHALAAEWERLLAEIRALPGFAHFMRPPDVADLLIAASGRAPAVIVNVSHLRCDAIMLTEGRIRVLPLPAMSQAELIRRADEFRSATARALHGALPGETRQTARRIIDETLEWLWTVMARPVLSALGFPPRLWWVPTGPLTVLPLHAAGRHGAPGECVLDRVVSSYAPTVRALVSGWRRADRDPRRGGAPPAPLIVSASGLPGIRDLPGVREETAALAGRIPGCRVLADGQAVRQAVLDALPRHRWAHFACHAVSAADGTASGRLILSDHADSPLTVTDLARLRLPDAELAYLSACETSVTRDDLGDEALHIAGACSMAGFRHVVGTLWEVSDALSPRVAGDFYAALLAAGADASQTASALHTAVCSMRAAHPGAAALWAPYIHVGP